MRGEGLCGGGEDGGCRVCGVKQRQWRAGKGQQIERAVGGLGRHTAPSQQQEQEQEEEQAAAPHVWVRYTAGRMLMQECQQQLEGRMAIAV